MKSLSNLHTHTLYCDGKNTPEEYIKKAIEKGFVSIGFSGHSYLDFGEEWYMGVEGTVEYIKEIKALKEKYAGIIEVYLGLETDYYSNLNKNSKKDLGLDYIIGSLHYVKNEGYDVIKAYDGKDALSKISTNPDIDLMILDIMMPKMDGMSATKKIRTMNRPDAAQIPIIAMTANAFEEDARKCVEAGMNAHLSKPLQMDVVVGTIAEYYKR